MNHLPVPHLDHHHHHHHHHPFSRFNKFSSLVLLILIFATQDSSCLDKVQIRAPRYVRRGEDVHLFCDFDMGSGSLYATKWYRNNNEFYRYLPKEVPPQQVFKQQMIDVNVTHSNDHLLILTRVPFDISGTFKCVVSEETTFKTLSAVQDVNVVAIGYGPPLLYLDQDSYNIGEQGKANCSIDKISPTVNVTWLVNDREVPASKPVTYFTRDREDAMMSTMLSTLHFDIADFLPFKLQCKIDMFDLYSETSSTIIQPKKSRTTAPSSSSSSPESANSMFRGNSTVNKKYLRGLMSTAARSWNSLQNYNDYLTAVITLFSFLPLALSQ